MKKLILIFTIIFSFVNLHAQNTTDGYLTNGDIVSIGFDNWGSGYRYLEASTKGLLTTNAISQDCMWEIGITLVNGAYNYTFYSLSTQRYLGVQDNGNQNYAMVLTNSPALFKQTEANNNAEEAYLNGKFYYTAANNVTVYLNWEGGNYYLQTWWSHPNYIEKWEQSGDGNLKGYFSPELLKFGMASNDEAAKAQKTSAKFVFPTHLHSSLYCIHRPELVLAGSEAEVTEFPTPTIYWKSNGKNGSNISVLDPADYHAPEGVIIEGRNMYEVSDIAQDATNKHIWNFNITPLTKSPKNLQHQDKYGNYLWVNYIDTLVAEYTYGGQTHTQYMEVDRNAYHEEDLPSLVLSINPGSYTFAKEAETLNIDIIATHQHGRAIYDVNGNIVEKIYTGEGGLEPTRISSLNSNGWTTALTIEYPNGTEAWISSATVNTNSITVIVPENTTGRKRSAVIKGELGEGENRHQHKGTFAIQLHQRGTEGGIQFITQLGAGKGNADQPTTWHEGDPQPVHTAERTIYYLPGQDIELKLPESGFSGYMRWYDYDTKGNPLYNDRHAGKVSTTWHSQPQGASGQWFVNINTPASASTVDTEGHSWGLYALNKGAKDTQGRALTAEMGAILDEGLKTNGSVSNPAPVLHGWEYGSITDKNYAAAYHTMACDVSAYTDYKIEVGSEDNVTRITSITEPTLSYRQLFHLKPAEEIADKFGALADGKYLEEYHYLAPVGPDVYLSTEFRHGASQPETEKCYFYWSNKTNGVLKRVDGNARWYDENGNNVTPGSYNAKDYLDVDAQSAGVKTYYLRVPNAFGTGQHLNIAKFTIEFLHKNECGPSAAIMSMEQIYAQYKVLEYIDFNFGAEAPNTTDERYLSTPLPWEYATYGFVYPSDITGDGNEDYVRGDNQGEFPYFGEYRLVNKVDKNFGGSAGVSGENHGGAAKGYAMYVDGTIEPGMVASISTNAVICSSQTMYCSIWLRNPSSTAHEGATPIFRCNIQGRKKTNEKDANGKEIYTDWEDAGVFFSGSIEKNSGWQQILFPVQSASTYDETRVSLYNFATNNMANDFMIDDICLFVSQLPFAAYQGKMACRTTADSKTHAVAVLRLDYSQLGDDADGHMYYQIYNETTQTEVNLTGENDGARYYHDKHDGQDHTDQHHYGSVKIPDAEYEPQSGDKTYQSVTKFVDDLMASGIKNDKAYIQVDNDGVTKWLLYVGHIIENTDEYENANILLYSKHDYLIRMAHTPEELSKAACNMQTPLHSTQATTFELKNSDGDVIKHRNENGTLKADKDGVLTKIYDNSTNNEANDLYFLTSNIHNSLALKTGGNIEDIKAPIYSDWLVIYDTWDGMDIYAEDVPTDATELENYRARLTASDAKFKEKYKYTRGEIAAAIMHDMRRVPTDDDPNPNYDAKAFDELDPNGFQTHENYNIIKHLHDNGWLEMNKTTVHFYLGSANTARYWAYPIEGTAKTTINDGSKDIEITLMDCKEALWVKVSSKESNHHLNVAPLSYDEKNAQQKVQLPTVKVLETQLNNVQVPVTDIEYENKNHGGIYIGQSYYSKESTISINITDDQFLNWGRFIDIESGELINGRPELICGNEYTIRITMYAHNGGSGKGDKVGYIFFKLQIIPSILVWTPVGTSFNGWGKNENWKGWVDSNNNYKVDEGELTEGYVPISGANVVIPKLDNSLLYPYIVPDDDAEHKHSHYPMTVGFEPHSCNNIYFEPGAHIHNQHLLEYENAFVDMQITAGAWNMVSAPLQNMVSGDMYIPHEGNWQNGNSLESDNVFKVSTFQGARHTDAAYVFWQGFYNTTVDIRYEGQTDLKQASSANFVYSNALDQALTVGSGYQLYGLGPGNNGNTGELTIRLPKPDQQYYYYTSNGQQSEKYVTLPTENRGRLAFSPNNGVMDITLTNRVEAGSYFLFGNPTMAYIDMKAFLTDTDNAEVLNQVFYRVENSTWKSATELTLEQDRYLAPMTSVMLETKDNSLSEITVHLKPEHLTLNNHIYTIEEQSEEPGHDPHIIAQAPNRSTASEIMTIYTYAKNAHARTVLATNPAANDYYQVGEDALFVSTGIESKSDVTLPLSMYTVAEQVPMMTDVRQGISQIPLSVLATSSTRSQYMQVAFYLTANWTRTCYFCDSKTGQKTRIMDGLVISVEMPLNHEQRYYIEGPDTYQGSEGVETSTTQTHITTNNKVWAYAPDRNSIVVSASDLIKSASLYDVTGRLITTSNESLITNSLTLNTAGTAGVYIVQVTLRDNTKAQTQVIVQ